MKKSLSLLSIFFIISVSLYAQTWMNVQWAGSPNDDSGNGVCTDANNNVFVTGSFADSVQFGTTVLHTPNGGWRDIFVTKYNSSMGVVWAKRYGGTDHDEAYAIKTDVSGNIYIAGSYGSSITFDTITLVQPAGPGIFIVKLNASGTALWAKSATTVGSDFYVAGLALDANNNIYISGFYAGNADFGNSVTLSSIIHPQYLTGSIDIFTAKYNNSGTCQWARSAGSWATDRSYGVAVTPNGTSYITGFYGQDASFSGSNLFYNGGGVDGFIAGYNTSGTLVFLTPFYSPDYESGYGIALDAASNIYITGLSSGFTVFDTETITPHGSYDMFIAKYNSAGDIQWVNNTLSSQWEHGRNVVVDAGGNVYVGGEFYHGGTSSFPGIFFTSKGYYDPFVVKYNHVGEFEWAQRGGSYRYDYLNGIALADSGKIIITGSYGDSSRFSNFLLPRNGALGGKDYYIAKIRSDINTVAVSGLPACAGNSINVTYKANIPFNPGNVFTVQLSNAQGYFANAVNIGSINSSGSGVISAVIPANTVNGTQYRVRVVSSDSARTGGDNGTALTIWALPNAVITSGGTDFCIGDSLQMIAGFVAGNTIQWQLNGVNISGATGSTYYAKVTADFRILVTEPAHGCTQLSNTIHATKRSKPAATITPGAPLSFCSGGSVMLYANGGANLSYQWKKNNVNINGETNSTYSASTAGNYKVTVTNQYGCVKTSSTVTVTVYSKPAAIISAVGPVSFCAGDSVILSANSGAGLTYLWKKNGANISGATAINYTAKTAGIYKCTVTNANGCSKTSNTITVSIPCRLNNEVYAAEADFNLFPNPVNDKAILTYSIGERKNVTVEIINSLGEIIQAINEGEKENGEFTVEINTSGLASGYYMVRLMREDSSSYKKLIKL